MPRGAAEEWIAAISCEDRPPLRHPRLGLCGPFGTGTDGDDTKGACGLAL